MKVGRLALAVALASATAGCGFIGPSDEGNGTRVVSKISLQEAADQADAIILSSVRSVRPELTWVHGPSLDGGCDSYKIDGKDTGSISRKIVVMTIISEQKRGSLLGVIERYWKKQGYEITGVNPNKEMPAIYARTHQDFRMRVSVGKKGQFFFGITTPCFIASTVVPPKILGNGTPYEGHVIPDPYVHSDLWSTSGSLPSRSATTR